ncbi:hypothetical protein M231_06058 [Tremella mesenterica]|uniref:Uncharacterized protein n=1 Tax=Tremella mesenterica TaxID=5217 RepID=A0A4Q1BGI8_TREME|nr:hypothetical protein M231_06058 [Tremella mesenterica]
MRLTVPLSLCVWLFHLIVLCTAQQSQTKSSALLNTAKRLFQVALGQTPVEDLLARDEADRAAGVTRITRNNYEKLLTDGEWVILVHGKDPLSPRFLEMHTNASLASQELSLGIKWGRVDLIEETYISMRWLLFRPPYLVFISNSGHDLRFLSPRHVHPEGDRLLEFVEKKQWKDLPIWNSRYGPDGDR